MQKTQAGSGMVKASMQKRGKPQSKPETGGDLRAKKSGGAKAKGSI